MPSVQSLVATSRRPNIWGAVMALGFMRISLCGWPHSEGETQIIINNVRVSIQVYMSGTSGIRKLNKWIVMPSRMLSSLCHPKMIQTFGHTRCNDKTWFCQPTSHCSHQRVNASRFPGTAGPKGHHAVSDPLSLKQLDDLQLPGRVTDQACVLDLGENRCLVQQGRSGFNRN